MQQVYIRAQIYDENAAGQLFVAPMATGADGIRFWTDRESVLTAADLRQRMAKQTAPASAAELKPCPFCGGEADFIGDTQSIKCKRCGGAFICTNPLITFAEIAEAWNGRTAAHEPD